MYVNNALVILREQMENTYAVSGLFPDYFSFRTVELELGIVVVPSSTKP